MNDSQYFTIPQGYILLSRPEYDDMIEQRVASRADRAELEAEYAKELNRLKAIISSRDRELSMLRKDYTELSDREAKLAYRLHEANESILSLKAEIRLLNEELCKTDEFHEFHEATHTERSDQV